MIAERWHTDHIWHVSCTLPPWHLPEKRLFIGPQSSNCVHFTLFDIERWFKFSSCHLDVPRTRLKNRGDRAFAVAALNLCSSLTFLIETAQTVESFKWLLKAHLISLALDSVYFRLCCSFSAVMCTLWLLFLLCSYCHLLCTHFIMYMFSTWVKCGCF